MTAEKTPGQVSWTARNLFLAGPGDQPGDVLAELESTWECLSPEEREAEEAGAQAVLDAATEGALRACGYTLADVARFLEAEAAGQQPAPVMTPEQQTAAGVGTVRHAPTGATWITWPEGRQPPWELVDEAVGRLTGGAVKVRVPAPGDEDDPGRLQVAVYRDLPELEDE